MEAKEALSQEEMTKRTERAMFNFIEGQLKEPSSEAALKILPEMTQLFAKITGML